MDKELTVPKLGGDSLAENIPNAPEFICTIYLHKPTSSGFHWNKASLGVPSPCLLLFKKGLSCYQGNQLSAITYLKLWFVAQVSVFVT